jgi:hypothetical protein
MSRWSVRANLPALLLIVAACSVQPATVPPEPRRTSIADFSNQDLIDQLEIDKSNFQAQARAAVGAHRAIRLMKINQLDEVIDQLKHGQRPTPKELAEAERLTPEPLWQFGWY